MWRLSSFFARLGLHAPKAPTRPRLIVIGPNNADACVAWEPLSLPQGQALGLTPGHRRYVIWEVAGQAPRRQYTLADVYQWLRIPLTERQKAWLFARAPQYRKYLNHQ